MEATLSFHSVPLHWGGLGLAALAGPSPPRCNPLLVSPLSALFPLVCRGADRITPALPSLPFSFQIRHDLGFFVFLANVGQTDFSLFPSLFLLIT